MCCYQCCSLLTKYSFGQHPLQSRFIIYCGDQPWDQDIAFKYTGSGGDVLICDGVYDHKYKCKICHLKSEHLANMKRHVYAAHEKPFESKSEEEECEEESEEN